MPQIYGVSSETGATEPVQTINGRVAVEDMSPDHVQVDIARTLRRLLLAFCMCANIDVDGLDPDEAGA